MNLLLLNPKIVVKYDPIQCNPLEIHHTADGIHQRQCRPGLQLWPFGICGRGLVESDLHPVHDHNVIIKFADDTYLTVPGSKRDTMNEELEDIQRWALLNNLKLNPDKSKEMLFRRRTRTVILPPPLPGIERVDSMIVLGVNISYDLRASAQCSSLHALRIARAHGLPLDALRPTQCGQSHFIVPTALRLSILVGYDIC